MVRAHLYFPQKLGVSQFKALGSVGLNPLFNQHLHLISLSCWWRTSAKVKCLLITIFNKFVNQM